MRAISSGIERYVAKVSKIASRDLKSYEVSDLFDTYRDKVKAVDKCLFATVAKQFSIATICFQNVVRKRDGHFVSDHIWLDLGQDMNHLKEGDIVEFDAEPLFYTKQVPELYDKGLRITSEVDVCVPKACKSYNKAISVISAQKDKISKFIKERIEDGQLIG